MKKYIGSIISAVVLSLILFTPTFAMSFDQDLRYGLMRNQQVRDLQTFLTDEGYYSGPISGNFLSMTRRSLNNFQKDNGLKVVSKLDKSTREIINQLLLAKESYSSPTLSDNTIQNDQFITLYDLQNNAIQFDQSQVQMALNSGYSYFPKQNFPTQLSNNVVYNTNNYQSNTQSDNSVQSNQTNANNQINTQINTNNTNQNTNPQNNQNSNVVPQQPQINNASPTTTTSTTSIVLNSLIGGGITDGGSSGIFTFNSLSNYPNIPLTSLTVFDQRVANYVQATSTITNLPINNSPVKIQSISIKNLGTLDLKKTNLNFRFYSNSVDKTGNPNNTYNIPPNSLTTSTASFTIPTWILNTTDSVTGMVGLYADIQGQNIGDTVKIQFTDIQLLNTDPTKNYSVRF